LQFDRQWVLLPTPEVDAGVNFERGGSKVESLEAAGNPAREAHESSVVKSLDVLGDRWTLLILREAFAGIRRFEGFRENLGIARNILSGRLRHLVREGIFERRLYQSHPDRYEYRLTEKGNDLADVLGSFRRWGERWMKNGRTG
jgi:DNA-binding HxlR family transcriptional regulator